MANEYRIAQLSGEVLHAGGGQARVVHAELSVLHGDQASLPNARIMQLRLEALHSDQSSLPNALIYQNHAEVLMDVRQLVSPTFVDGSGDSTGEAFEIRQIREIGPPRLRIADRERNPFPTTVVGLDSEEQQRNFRAQHNLAQAGDSTFDYGLLLKHNPDRLYTLGSLGKFYHDDYGIIHARYVQFTQWVDVPFQGCPVGKLKTGESFDWVVTNDFEKSGSDLAQGFAFFADPPPEGSFGWMVVDGANPTSISRFDNTPPLLEAEYVWTATGVIHFATPGKVIARRATEPGVIGIGPGTIYIKIEGASLAAISERVTESLSSTIATVDLLAVKAEETESQVTNLLSATNNLSSNIGQVDARLVRESQARARDIQSIRQELGAVDYSQDIQLALDTAREEFQAADNILGIRIADVEFKADAALAAAGGDSSPLIAQLDALVLQLGAFNNRLENFRVNYPTPVAGDVLVSAIITSSDGAEDAEFVPRAFQLSQLFDVDLVTTPPADNDSLVWNSTLQKWVPEAVSGGGGGISDAPSDGNFYARRDGAWEAFTPGSGGGPNVSFVQSKGIALANISSGITLDAAPTENNILVAIMFNATLTTPPNTAGGWVSLDSNTAVPDANIAYRVAGPGESTLQIPTTTADGGVILIMEFQAEVALAPAGSGVSTNTSVSFSMTATAYNLLPIAQGIMVGFSGRRTDEAGNMAGSFVTEVSAQGSAALVGGSGVSAVAGYFIKNPGPVIPAVQAIWPTSAASRIGVVFVG